MSPIARLAGSDAALFASDMHLGDHDPDTAALFLSALARESADITHLLLLGDIFEAWVGDDQPDRAAAQLAEYLRALTARGIRVILLCGNRDFLLGKGPQTGTNRWPERCGARLVDEPATIELFGQAVLIAHGDAFCTDDLEYQQFRAQVRQAAWQQSFLARPLQARLDIAREMRHQSERNKATQQQPGDVNPAGVASMLREHGLQTLIHGHTHRPGCYPVETDSGTLRRWVLPDWHASEARGGFLRIDALGWHDRPA